MGQTVVNSSQLSLFLGIKEDVLKGLPESWSGRQEVVIVQLSNSYCTILTFPLLQCTCGLSFNDYLWVLTPA